jgi:hypothetical protein
MRLYIVDLRNPSTLLRTASAKSAIPAIDYFPSTIVSGVLEMMRRGHERPVYERFRCLFHRVDISML